MSACLSVYSIHLYIATGVAIHRFEGRDMQRTMFTNRRGGRSPVGLLERGEGVSDTHHEE